MPQELTMTIKEVARAVEFYLSQCVLRNTAEVTGVIYNSQSGMFSVTVKEGEQEEDD